MLFANVIRSLSAAALLCACAVPASAGFINGGFESPVVGTGGQNGYSGTGITGWTVVGPNNSIGLVDTNFGPVSGFTFNADTGNQWADLTGPSDPGGANGLEQAVGTTAGQAYELSFALGLSGYNQTTTSMDLYIDGVFAATFTNNTLNGLAMSWEHFTYTFTAATSSTTFTFLNTDPAGYAVNGLDSVAVAAVPEPSTMALAGMGACSLIAAAIRRRRQQAV